MPSRALSFWILLFGILCFSTAIILFKLSQMDPALLSALRLLLATVILSPWYFRDRRIYRGILKPRHLLAAVLPGVMLATHFVSLIYGSRLTTAANSTLIITVMPLILPFMLIVAVREKPTRVELLATVMAVAGVILQCSFDFSTNKEYFLGDVICFFSLLAVSLYVALGRRNQHLPSLWLYVVPIYAIAGGLCMLVAVLRLNPLNQSFPPREIFIVIGLAVIPTALGHSILNLSLRHLRGQVVSVVGMTQIIFTALIAWPVLGEIPSWPTYVAAALIFAGGYVVIRQSLRQPATELIAAIPEVA